MSFIDVFFGEWIIFENSVNKIAAWAGRPNSGSSLVIMVRYQLLAVEHFENLRNTFAAIVDFHSGLILQGAFSVASLIASDDAVRHHYALCSMEKRTAAMGLLRRGHLT